MTLAWVQRSCLLGDPSQPSCGSTSGWGACPARPFIGRYWDGSANNGKGSCRYPPDNGFVVGPDGKPVESAVELVAGTDIDRFGSEYGAFLAPAGTLYDERSIPPQSLDTFDPKFPDNYHDYRVVKAFEVEDGPIAPAFDQPGLGVQFMLDPSLIAGAPTSINVAWMVQKGYLQPVS